MKKYELMLIINPSLQEEERNKVIWEIKAELKSASLKIESEEILWEKILAYKINNSKIGYYLIYKLESDKNAFFDLVKALNIKKNVWRHLFLKLEETL
jgi:small subunit ribosomal protein S6